jgi:ribonuclease HI
MKQLELFTSSQESQSRKSELTYWKLCIDGASRKNPGPSGVGICLLKNNMVVVQHGYYVGVKTNNQAEYLALLIGLYYVQQQVKKETVLIVSDSQLLVRQLIGHYKTKDATLKLLHGAALRVLTTINYDIAHVMREENTQADELANHGIDKKKLLPPMLKKWLELHEITF